MCDYSLYRSPSRPRADREELVAHRFPSGCISLISSADARNWGGAYPSPWLRAWAGLRSWLLPRMTHPGPVAVCVSPGTRLTVASNRKGVFTQRHPEASSCPDALQFDNGREILLQELLPGTRIQITSTVDEGEGSAALAQEVSYESA